MATNTIDTKKIDNATDIPVAAFVEEPRPVSPQPQQIQYVPGSDPRVAMRGGQPGGVYSREQYCGPISWIICCAFCAPCAICCPCDEREVYISPPDGRRIVLS